MINVLIWRMFRERDRKMPPDFVYSLPPGGIFATVLPVAGITVAIMLFVIVQHDRPFSGAAAILPGPIPWATGAEM
ncbi:hypothetical protein [Aestuariivirga sp.]|uniref:hypothetical protein n=1 Tax=Aestuariivirga sp. TaxID=2650926 RepID=UPI0025BF2F4D|nr:hypothetical protein [Aestuariivirga sp.]MCA3554498.1 hypothetical protein [Aestuariivirga sp.]